MGISSAIIAVGSEILDGSIVDTNSSHISRLLNHLGINNTVGFCVKDDKDSILDVLNSCVDCDLILITGGLGPTSDDITAECIAKFCSDELTLNVEALNITKARLKEFGFVFDSVKHVKQAYLPSKAILFNNRLGTACGFAVNRGKSIVIALPGVPFEMKEMLSKFVINFIRDNFVLEPIFVDNLSFIGVNEVTVENVIDRLVLPKNCECIINASPSEVVVRLKGNSCVDFAKIFKI